jgi:hypothetical protein
VATTYGAVWWVLCGVVIALGLAIGLVLLPGVVWALVAMVAVVASLTAIVGYETGIDDVPRQGRVRLVLTVMTACLAVVAVAALAVVLGAGALLLALMLAVGSPRALHWYGGLLRGKADRPHCPDASVVSTSQLCREWLESYEALSQVTSSTARLRIVMARQRCLDELERRDPDGLHAWLSASASAGGDPSRFLTHGRSDTPPANA